MSLLGDIMGEAIFSGVGELIADLPPRVRHTLTGLAGVSLAAGVGAVITAWPAAVSAVTLVNDLHDRPFALFALLGCCAAAALPMTAMTL
jgi:hypothetical protein